jgi:uncharacterized NAD(P)/FAD-binding protein YdhS
MKRVLIVGGGASGVLVALNILRLAQEVISIEIAEPREDLGQGLAYSTMDNSHLLNVPAGRMSAFPDQPSDFVDWTGRDSNYFAPRKDYARYLSEKLAQYRNQSSLVDCVHRKVLVDNLSVSSTGWHAMFHDGTTSEYEQIVLAMGHGLPLETPQLSALRESSRFQTDPWRETSEDFKGTLIGVGTGLTFIDLALSHLRNHSENKVIGISRNGLLPEAHLAKRAEPLAVPPAARTSASAIRSFIENASDWRAAQDGVRHELPAIWFGWDEEEKREFFSNHLRWWNVRRHRVSGEIQSEIDSAVAEGRLMILKDEIERVSETAVGVDVELRSGVSITASKIVNCLGYDTWRNDCLLSRLIENGVATVGPLGLGIQSEFPNFRIKKPDAGTHSNLYVIGSLLLGERFETTAIPELKEQALEIAKEITKEIAKAVS